MQTALTPGQLCHTLPACHPRMSPCCTVHKPCHTGPATQLGGLTHLATLHASDYPELPDVKAYASATCFNASAEDCNNQSVVSASQPAPSIQSASSTAQSAQSAAQSDLPVPQSDLLAGGLILRFACTTKLKSANQPQRHQPHSLHLRTSHHAPQSSSLPLGGSCTINVSGLILRLIRGEVRPSESNKGKNLTHRQS